MAEPQEPPIPWNAEARIVCSFSFQCPKQWDQLVPTNQPTIRRCTICHREVHLALTEEDFRRYREPGMCVAVQVVSSDNTTSSTESFVVGRADLGDYRPHPLKPI